MQYLEILLVFQKSKTIFVIQKYILFFFKSFPLHIISHVVKNNSTEGVCRIKAQVFFGKF